MHISYMRKSLPPLDYTISSLTRKKFSACIYVCGLVMDFMICLLESVRQEESFKSFVCLSVRSVAFPVAKNHGSQLLPCSHSNE